MIQTSDILSAYRRSERVRAEQIATWEALDFGVAYSSTRFPLLAELNQLRDVWFANALPDDVWERAKQCYNSIGTQCRQWTPASSQPIAPLDALMTARGWQRIETLVLALHDWHLAATHAGGPVRMLPARAMPKAYRAVLQVEAPDSSDPAGQWIDAQVERLNDPNLDAFVAMGDGAPIGRIAYLGVGDTARVLDAFVVPQARRRGVGSAMTAYTLQLARRLLPRVVVAAVPQSDKATIGFLIAAGFAPVSVELSFQAPRESLS